MRKLFLLTTTVIFFVVFANAQKKVYDENAEVRITGKDFHGIKISGGIDLYLSQGNETNVVASATETKFRDRIKTEIVDGILRIWFDSDGGWKWNTGHKQLKVYVSCKMIDELTATGASDVNIEGVLKTGDLQMKLSGASDLKGNITASKLVIDQSGASDTRISGSATELKLTASGASDFKGFDFVVQNCDAHASGASDIQITVNKELKAHASGASDIYYKGNAVVTDMHSSGASSVKKSG
ncbi:MAG: head GIN domain-containing protein [Sphingobacteriales bacterium]